MPQVTFRKGDESFTEEVADNTNLVVRAGIKKFPFPHLRYRCGMGKCGTCASRILEGAENLPAPNWKEEKILGERLAQGWRLCCQLWLHHDLTLTQDPIQPPLATPPAQNAVA
jgi:ferredoxin